MALVYATRAELVAYAPAGIQPKIPAEPEATRLLTSASKCLRRNTKTAIYVTDVDGYPTDSVVRQGFRDAACAQAVWWIENPGSETGAANQWDSVSIGSVRLSRGGSGKSSSSGGGAEQELAPQAYTELSNAGILPGSVVHSQPWDGSWQ